MTSSTNRASLIERLEDLLSDAEISLRGSSNNGCTVEIKLPGSSRGREAMELRGQLKELQFRAKASTQ